MLAMTYSRYAIYLTPPIGSDLWAFGSAVIGRDASTGQDVEGFSPEGFAAPWRELTGEPRRHGFHATLIAPFRLRADLDIVDLIDRVAAFARASGPFDACALEVARIAVAGRGAFVALRPTGPARELHGFADEAVRKLALLRAPLTEAERRRRESGRLTPLQRYFLDLWGYPYVLTEFRPHFTLTNVLADARPAEKALRSEFDRRVASKTLRVETLALFGERDGRFDILREFPLGRRAPRVAMRVAAAAFID